ncbi:MAG: ABC transporter permease, partial [Mycoplasmataceae bacterium]|nr:ABC transporter permease [Mycoplasmataceae bacterium]
VATENWIDTDNLIVFVNEDTLFNILKENYYNKDTTGTGINQEWDERTYNTSSTNSFTTISGSSTPSESVVNYKYFVSLDKFVDRDYLKENKINNYTQLFKFFSDNIEIDTFSNSLFSNGIAFRGSTTNGFIPSTDSSHETDLLKDDIVTANDYVKKNDNFKYANDFILNSKNSVNIFGIFILIIGIVVIGFLISRSFRNDVTWMGNLKALGYSQSTISLLLVTKIIIYLLLGFVFTVILSPIMNILWINISTLTITLPSFYVTLQSFVFTILFPFLIFISFAFLISRFFFISKDTLSLVKDEVLAKPNKLIKKLDSVDNVSFSKSYSVKNSIRNASKSAAILISSISICVFILLSFSVSDALEKTVGNISDSYVMEDLSLIKTSSSTKKNSVMTNEEFQEGIDNGTITDYTFGLNESSVSKLLTEAEAATTAGTVNYSCNELYGTMYKYVKDAPISNTYISNQTLTYLNEVINAYPENLNNCNTKVDGLNSRKSKNVLNNFLNFIRVNFDDSNIHYLDYYLKQYPSSLGISLGTNVVDKENQVSSYNITRTNLIGDDRTTISWITFVEEFKDLSKMYKLTDEENNELSELDDSNKDGRITFFVNDGHKVDNVSTSDILNFKSNQYCEYVEWIVPLNFYNSNLSSTLTNDERTVKLYYGGTVDIPFSTSLYLPYADPDWTDVLKNSITTDKSIADNNVFIESELPTSLNFAYFTETNSNDDSTNEYSLEESIDFFTSESSINKISTKINEKYGVTLSDKKLTDSINKILSRVINELGASSINLGNPLSKSFTLDFSNFENTDLDNLTSDYYNDTMTLFQLFDNPKVTIDGIIPTDRNLQFLGNQYLLENIEYIDSLLGANNLYFSGVTLNISDIYIDLSTPSIEPIQIAIYPLSIMTTLIAISLIFILINEIIKDNKNNTNVLKTMGHSSTKTTLITYMFYPIILLLGFFIAIPVVIGIGSFITSSIAPAMDIAAIIITPSLIQFLYTFIIILGVTLITYLISQLMTSNLRPQLSTYRN